MTIKTGKVQFWASAATGDDGPPRDLVSLSFNTLDEALKQLKDWQKEGYVLFTLSTAPIEIDAG